MNVYFDAVSNLVIPLNQDLDKRGLDLLGECLRALFFDQTKGFGCYSSFELKPYVTTLPNEPVEDDPVEFHYTVAKVHDIKMRYFWDGDGYLEFILPNGKVIFNSDCKCDHGWKISNMKE